ncbi:hypothetical protein U9M48_025450 [Paspalum notatum var. saurae]|uniref:Uncharacterized protein n=1 Tax=Paspalum notatum var. saurae TaxID=547442 RepID=A0AAQ3TUZ2_PASNO
MSSSPAPPCSEAAAGTAPAARPYCMCAPTTHPGSFRCRLHRSPPAAAAAASEEAKEAAAARARALLERMARKARRPGGVLGMVRPGPSRLGATATDDDKAP